MNKGPFLSTFLGFFAVAVSFSQPQTDRYMVFFKDKVGTPYSVTNPQQFLSTKSINRRTKQSISIEAGDLPVTPSYVNSVSSTGAKVLFRTKWMNGVLIEATATQKTSVENLTSFVSRVEFVASGKTGSGGRARASNKLESSGTFQASQNQNSMLALDVMHNDGITGYGVSIAVFDTGFPGIPTNLAFSNLISSNRIKDSYNFSVATPNAFVGHPHGAQVFSIIASTLSNFSGGAFDADFFLYATEFVDSEFRVEEYNWLFAAERADSAGADIISSSLGYTDFDDPSMNYSVSNLDGKTAVITKAANIAFTKGIVVVNSAGNYGDDRWTFIGPPADGENVLAVGSVNVNFEHAAFSSYGPTADGRIKPDVMAMGGGAAFVSTNGTVGFGNGTSYSCPMITSLVAGVIQQWPELSAAQIVSLIREAGSLSFSPNNTFGYGIPTYKSIKDILEIPNTTNNSIVVYPNPITESTLNIAILLPADASDMRVQVYSILGQPIENLTYLTYKSIWDLNLFHIDVSSLAPGYYLVKVENKGLTKTFRVIKN